MRKCLLTTFVVLTLLGSMFIIIPNVSACHKLIVSCSPNEKDIVNNTTWKVTYEIDVELRAGCGSIFWVRFNVSAADPKFHRNLYEKGDPNKINIDHSGVPPDGNHNDKGWLEAHVSPGCPAHYYALLEVWCDPNTKDFENTAITVNVWSVDNNNDLYNKNIAAKTTVNIPNSIMYSTDPVKSIQLVKPGEWVEYNITVEDIDGTFGQIDLFKDAKSSPCFDNDWEWLLPNNVTIEQPYGTAEFTLKVKPPLNAEQNDEAYFWVYGENHKNSSYNHTIWVKTIVDVPKPDLSVKNDEEIANIELLGNDFSEGKTYNISADVYNLGKIPVSNFTIAFKISIQGGGKETIGIMNINLTIKPKEYITVQYQWEAIEGIHWLSVGLDPEKSIDETDEETNNGGGFWAFIGPRRPKKIISEVSVEPKNIMPGAEFIISGTVIYNNYYYNSPVKNEEVIVRIKSLDMSFKNKTDKDGRVEIFCTAPESEAIYSIEIIFVNETVNTILNDFIKVSFLNISAEVQPSPVITGDLATIAGKVTDLTFIVKDSNVTIDLLDDNNNSILSKPVNTNTDENGEFNITIETLVVTECLECTVTIIASKGEIFGSQSIKLLVDIDTDNDGICNQLDNDDDNDMYLDTNDKFPLNPKEWADSDEDGVGDNSDAYPTDPSKWAASKTANAIDSIYLWFLILILIIGIISLSLYILKPREVKNKKRKT